MTDAKNIFDFINSFAPFETQMSFDNSGLLIGDENAVSDKIIVTLDVTRDVIRQAVSENAHIIISHHPVIFNSIKSLASSSIPFLCAKNGLTVISAHTNLDIAPNGVNDTLAKLCGVVPDKYINEECLIFGHLSSTMDCPTFAKHIKNTLNISGLRFSDNSKHISKIAVACGAGGSNVFLAKKYSADAIITGEIKHHEIIFANDNDIAVFDLGHFNSENIIIPQLIKKLSDRFNNITFIQSNFTDKMNYLG